TCLQRKPGDKADVLALAVFEDGLPLPFSDVVFVLHRYHWEKAAGSFDLIDVHFRQAGVTNFSFALELLDRAELVLLRHVRIDSMQLPQVDALEAQPCRLPSSSSRRRSGRAFGT